VNGKERLGDEEERQKEVPATDRHPTPAAIEARLCSAPRSIAGIWKLRTPHHDAICISSTLPHSLTLTLTLTLSIKFFKPTQSRSLLFGITFIFSRTTLISGTNLIVLSKCLGFYGSWARPIPSGKSRIGPFFPAPLELCWNISSCTLQKS